MKSLPRTIAILAFAVAMTVTAQKDSSMSPPGGDATNQIENGEWKMENGGSGLAPANNMLHSSFFTLHSPVSRPQLSTVNSQPSTPLWRLDSVATNSAVSYERFEGTLRNEYWWKRGGIETAFRLRLDGFTFPLGTNEVRSLIATAFGAVRAFARRPETEILASTSRLAAEPFQSEFWYGRGTNANYFLTWRNFRFAEPPHDWVNAQIELKSSGDFIVRSNEVETAYRRIEPFDWDGDGLPNEIDPNPYDYDGDHFGPANELPAGANTNCYYWVDVVSDTRTALVRFAGDGASNYPDPYFIARAGETNRVMLLIGKTYEVEAEHPVYCVATSTNAVEAGGYSWPHIVWPVSFAFNDVFSSDGGSMGFTAAVEPSFLEGLLIWDSGTNHCGVTACDGGLWGYSCGTNCTCGGCRLWASYEYEGFRLRCRKEGCRCGYSPNASAAWCSAAWANDVIIFEEAYTNVPDEVVGRHSATGAVTFTVFGGDCGGRFSLAVNDLGYLIPIGGDSVPCSGEVAPGETLVFTAYYEASVASSWPNDIIAVVHLTENVTGAVTENTAAVTAVRLQIVADESFPSNRIRHVWGPGETAKIYLTPEYPKVDMYHILPAEGKVVPLQGELGWKFIAPRQPTSFSLSCFCNDRACGFPFTMRVISPEGFRIKNVTEVDADWINLQRLQGHDTGLIPFDTDEAGVIMAFERYVEPSYVNFCKIAVFEGYAAPTNRTGWYLDVDQFPDRYLEHGYNNGAVSNYLTQASCLTGENSDGLDTVGGWIGRRSSYLNGSYELHIPIKWFCPNGETDPSAIFAPQPQDWTNVVQRISVDTNGTMRVEKHGVSCQRAISR